MLFYRGDSLIILKSLKKRGRGGREGKTKEEPLHSAVIVHTKEYSYLSKTKRWYDANPSNFKVLIMFSHFYFEG